MLDRPKPIGLPLYIRLSLPNFIVKKKFLMYNGAESSRYSKERSCSIWLLGVEKKIKTQRDDLTAKLLKKERISPEDERWLDEEANTVDDQQVLDTLTQRQPQAMKEALQDWTRDPRELWKSCASGQEIWRRQDKSKSVKSFCTWVEDWSWHVKHF
jgi:hypothetical protein